MMVKQTGKPLILECDTVWSGRNRREPDDLADQYSETSRSSVALRLESRQWQQLMDAFVDLLEMMVEGDEDVRSRVRSTSITNRHPASR